MLKTSIVVQCIGIALHIISIVVEFNRINFRIKELNKLVVECNRIK